MRHLFSFWVLLLSCFSGGQAMAAGYDCGLDNLTATEAAICANEGLSRRDDFLQIYYKNAQKQAIVDPFKEDQAALEILTSEQKEWLKKREGCGTDTACIAHLFDAKFGSSDLDFIAAKARRMADLPEDEFLVDYARFENLEVAFISKNTNDFLSHAQGDFSHNNQQWLVTYIDGKQSAIYDSNPEWGFPFMDIDLSMTNDPTELIAEAGDMLLRGEQQFRFDVRPDGKLKIIESEYSGVSRPAIGEITTLVDNYETMRRARSVGAIFVDCEISYLPSIFEITKDGLLPEIKIVTNDPWDSSLDIISNGDPISAEELNSFSQDKLYTLAVRSIFDDTAQSLQIFEYLESEGYELAGPALSCAREIEQFET